VGFDLADLCANGPEADLHLTRNSQPALFVHSAAALTDFRQHIVTQKIITPIDLERMYGAPGGAIYGLASNTTTSAFVRPTQQDSKIKGLFYCGGGTHPGGGVPLALLSGKHAAQLVMNTLK
jgi:phytoene dehydrogenase-like protein